jgi:hypothetical protein
MSEWRLDEEQLLQLNTRLQRIDDVLIHNCLTRTAQESKLFPLMPYLMLCFYDAYYRFPDLLRKATAVMSPEDLGHRARETGCKLSTLNLWGTINFYLNGRTCLIKTGLLRPQDNLEDLWFMVDFHHRFMRAYRRSPGQLWTLDAGDIAQTHEERQLQVFEADAFEAGEALRKAAGKFVATATQYNFLVHCESRMGLHASGPYRLGGERLLHTREFMDMGECDLSWLDGVADNVTHNNLTLTLITDGVGIEVSDWGTPYTSPENYQDRVIGVGLYTSDFLSDGYRPVGMGSAGELTETLGGLTEEVQLATRKLYSRFAEMSNDQLVEGGIYTYFRVPSEACHIAGVYDQDDWEFIDERSRRFWPLYNEEYALDAYVSHFGSMDGMLAGQNDYYLHPVAYGVWRRNGAKGPTPPPGRNASLVPATVLADDDYPRRVNSTGLASSRGTSLLPQKSGTYLFAEGKLTMGGMNQRAREFSSPLVDSEWRNLDEAAVRFRWREPEVDELYRHTQSSSRLLRGRGASLRRAEIDQIRTEAGERPWSEVTAQAPRPDGVVI